METKLENRTLIICLEGRIDTNNAAETEQKIFSVVEEKKNDTEKVKVDAGNLEYISSAGLRVLMKLRKSLGYPLEVLNVSRDVYDIFETTGFTELFDVKKALREISVEGCEVIGEGGNGKVYRLDGETIAKVYYGERNPLEKIRKNQEVTKNVFVQGIPSAIAFDVVKVGADYGVVYEMIDARTMLQQISEHPENIEEYADMIADTLMTLHSTEFAPGVLQDAKDNARNDILAVSDRGYYTGEETDRLMKLIDEIPDRNTFIHQDFHPGNMMYQNGEIVLIDVEDSGVGHPVLDLSSMYLVYVTAAKSNWGKTQGGITSKQFAKIWKVIISKYFNTTDKSRLDEINRILLGYSRIKFLRGIATSPSVPDFLRKPVTKMTKKKLFSTIDTLHAIP